MGGGPVGLTLALALARQGIRCVVLEEDGAVNEGSRALGMSRRTQDIWAALGLQHAVGNKGRPWYGGWTYYREQLVLEYRIPHEPALRHPPMLNLQQSYAEQFLIDEIERTPLIDLRWRHRLSSVVDEGGHVRAGIETEAGPYALRCRYLAACDGARSQVRSQLGLRMEGVSGEAHYLIVDVQIEAPMEMGRRAWFDPPYRPGATVLMHGQPDNVWRIDWQISPDEDLTAISTPDSIEALVSAHLGMIGVAGAWRVVWSSTYRAHARTLPDFCAGRVMLAGDAAHLIPIFGIRGLNSGVEDAWNMAWKIAFVLQGWAPPALLQTYSTERVAAARENLRLANRALRFMTPPSRGWRMMRDAVLSLALTQTMVRDLINPRQASLLGLEGSPLSSFPGRSAEVGGGPGPGEVLPNLVADVRENGSWRAGCLHLALGPGFTLLVLGEPEDPGLADPAGLRRVSVTSREHGDADVFDRGGAIFARLCPGGQALYLVRPDHHIAARWASFEWDEIRRALAIATCAELGHELPADAGYGQ